MDYIGDELSLFAMATNWKSYWSSKIKPLCSGDVLEVGAGIGTNLNVLISKDTSTWLALEPDKGQADQIIKAIAGLPYKNKVTVQSGVLSEVATDHLFDTILYIDVLEHIEEDHVEFDLAISHLKPGGQLVVLAPAHNYLFSPLDKAVGHYRRYDKASLSKLKSKVADLNNIFYLDSVGCMASFANAKFLEASMPSKKQLLFWDRLMVPLSRVMDIIFCYKLGKTIVATWQRKL